MIEEALVALEEVLVQCEQQKLKEGTVGCLLLMSQAHLQLQELTHSCSLLQEVEHDHQYTRLPLEEQILFLETKSLLLKSLSDRLCGLPGKCGCT